MAKKHRVSFIGKLLSKLPRDIKLLYPLYLASQLYLEESTYVSACLPKEWHGLTIAYASDIHYGPMFDPQRAIDLIQRINALNADVVLLGGDYGETTQTSIDFFQAIPDIQANLCVLAAIGNHDLAGTAEELHLLKSCMLARDIIPLQNECHMLQRGNSYLRFCATDDTRHGTPDTTILNQPMPENTFTIFFPHSPDILPSLTNSPKPKFDLAICGHTHGGQIAFFGHSLHSSSKYGDRYRTGWKQENGHNILISNGVGTSLIPMRIGAPPQYHLVTLYRED